MRFPEKWKEFRAALYSPHSSFNPWTWIFQLTRAALNDALSVTRINRLPWNIFLVSFAIEIQSLIFLAYVISLRSAVVTERWCAAEEPCAWTWVHDSIVLYLFATTLIYYVLSVKSRPGKVSQMCREIPDTSSINPKDDDTTQYHPSPQYSYCQTCQIYRPPRAHHCRICNICVLRYDHHCIWINNCVGLNNYRSFVLFMIHLTVACWYGTALLFWPFYEPLRERVKEHGFRWLYDNGTGVLNLPPLWDMFLLLFRRIRTERTADVVVSQIVIDIAYPILMGVGAVMSAFLGYHFKLMSMSYTTLEHRIVMDYQLEHHKTFDRPNPFNEGSWYNNIAQVLGPQWLWRIWIPGALTNSAKTEKVS
ncbi:hypothetical protein FisN_21Hh110 [Fistulifera solaris]|uniref:Palmitoyltransferase n=1 Tax=Fistulifera solaris TaxID=1519565 RepID=A0A1Z5KBA2_FISSO|nr:hypothetical protein FisN_21Hh110 [Fistulifera solaris]|eukprot:GAX23208.1 hypothetical protein FisN_21Hh110 [Fistulifera solaris]